jgi:hypothetical protein
MSSREREDEILREIEALESDFSPRMSGTEREHQFKRIRELKDELEQLRMLRLSERSGMSGRERSVSPHRERSVSPHRVTRISPRRDSSMSGSGRSMSPPREYVISELDDSRMSQREFERIRERSSSPPRPSGISPRASRISPRRDSRISPPRRHIYPSGGYSGLSDSEVRPSRIIAPTEVNRDHAYPSPRSLRVNPRSPLKVPEPEPLEEKITKRVEWSPLLHDTPQLIVSKRSPVQNDSFIL